MEHRQSRAIRHHRRGSVRGHLKVGRQGARAQERHHRPEQRASGGQQPSARAEYRADEAGNLRRAAALGCGSRAVVPDGLRQHRRRGLLPYRRAQPPCEHRAGDGQPLRDRAASAPYGARAAADSQPAAHRQHAAARQSVHAGAGSQPSPADKRKHRKRQQQPRLDCQRDGQAVAARRRTPLHGSWRFSPRSMQRAAYVE